MPVPPVKSTHSRPSFPELREIEVILASFSGIHYSVQVDPTDPVFVLKQLLMAHEGVPTSDQELVFHEHSLRDERSIESYGISKSSTIHFKLINRFSHDVVMFASTHTWIHI